MARTGVIECSLPTGGACEIHLDEGVRWASQAKEIDIRLFPCRLQLPRDHDGKRLRLDLLGTVTRLIRFDLGVLRLPYGEGAEDAE
jgi:hypothetical protein